MFAAFSEKRARILDAALARVSQYGVRRTSMEDIATQAGISRAALYLEFRNKDEIFRTAAQALQDVALAQAAAVSRGDGPFEVRLRATVEAKTLGMMEIAFSSPHGGEILDETNRLCGDIVADALHRFALMLTEMFEAAAERGEIDTARIGMKPADAATLLIKSIHGLKGASGAQSAGSPVTTIADYRTSLGALVRVFVAAMRTVPARPGRRTTAARAKGRQAVGRRRP